MVVIAARGDERGLVAHPRLFLETEHVAPEGERTVEVGDLEMHVPDVDPHVRIVGYLNFDVRGSPSPEQTVYKGGPFAARWLEHFERRRLRVGQIDVGGRSDHFPLDQAGVPTGGLFAGGYPCYHRACDRLANVDLAVLDELAAAAAFGVASFAPIVSD